MFGFGEEKDTTYYTLDSPVEQKALEDSLRYSYDFARRFSIAASELRRGLEIEIKDDAMRVAAFSVGVQQLGHAVMLDLQRDAGLLRKPESWADRVGQRHPGEEGLTTEDAGRSR